MGVDKNKLKQAAELDQFQAVERAELLDRAAHATMNPEQRRQFAEYLISHEASNPAGMDTVTGGDNCRPPSGPAAWLIRQRMSAGGPSPWNEDRAMVQRVSEASTWMAGQLDRKAADLEALEAAYQKIAPDFARRDEAAELEQQIGAARNRLAYLQDLGDLQLYSELTSETERQSGLEDLQQIGADAFGLARPDAGDTA